MSYLAQKVSNAEKAVERSRKDAEKRLVDAAKAAAKAAAQKQRSLDHQEMGDGCIHAGSGGERRK